MEQGSLASSEGQFSIYVVSVAVVLVTTLIRAAAQVASNLTSAKVNVLITSFVSLCDMWKCFLFILFLHVREC
jgi:hypothetical protein